MRHSSLPYVDEGSLDASVFYLGDAMNLSCGGEIVRFQRAMTGALATEPGGVPWFMAPGNHDSFMSGVFNSFIPTDEDLDSQRFRDLVASVRRDGLRSQRLDQSASESLEVRPFQDLSWWSAERGRTYAYDTPKSGPGWPGVCAGQGADAVPMNKLSWLAWYLASQAGQGVQFRKLGSGCDAGVIEGGGAIGAFTTAIRGQLHPPESTREVMNSWLSFVVQVVQKRDTAVALIDTSVGDEVGRAGLWNVASTVGSKGAVGDEQAVVLDAMLDGLAGTTRIILAGHHPFKDLPIEDQHRLAKIMRKHHVEEYFSAHTHAPSSRRAIAGVDAVEINIGSVTDWPMEGVVASLFEPSTPTKVVRAGLDCRLNYHRNGAPLSLTWRQACVHAPVAHRLASMTDAEAAVFLRGEATWNSPRVSEDCEVRSAAASLEGDMRTIENRETDEAFRDFLLCLATEASSIQCGKGYDSPCDSRLMESK